MANRLKNTIFLRLLTGVGIVLFLGLLIGYIYQDDIFQTIQDPRQPFQTYEKPEAADYNTREAWLALPDLNADPYNDPSAGDVFIVVPSVYRGGKHWVLPSDDLKRKSKLQRIVRPNYVAPYGTCLLYTSPSPRDRG